MKKFLQSSKKQYLQLGALIVATVAVIAALTVLCMPFFNYLADPSNQQQLREWIDSLGFIGLLVVLLIQILQIVIAFIPGEAVQLMAGVLYGAWGGLIICLTGSVLASSIIFFLVRRFGYRLVERIFGKKQLHNFKFFNSTKRVETVTFILFLLPGMPKDMLTYLAGISRIKPSRFLIISTFARIPALLTSTLMGSSVSKGNWEVALILFLVTGIVGIVGIRYKQQILDHFHRHHGENTME